MTSPRRIGFLTPGWPGQNTPSGIATSVYFLATGLREIGISPVILAKQIDGEGPSDIPVVEVPELDWRLWDRLCTKLGDGDAAHRHLAGNIAGAVREAMKSHGLDAVIMEETNGWPGWVQKMVPLPVFITLHGPWTLLKAHDSRGNTRLDQQREDRERRGYLRAAGIIAPSRNVLRAVEETVPLQDIPKIVLPNTLPCDLSVPLSATLPDRRILFVGRFDFLKGADTVLDAFSRVIETHPEARLTFAGPDRGVRQPDGSMRHIESALAALPEAARRRINYPGPLAAKRWQGCAGSMRSPSSRRAMKISTTRCSKPWPQVRRSSARLWAAPLKCSKMV